MITERWLYSHPNNSVKVVVVVLVVVVVVVNVVIVDNRISHYATPVTCYVHRACGLRGYKNWPALFPGRMSYKETKPGLVSVLYYLSMRSTVLLFISARFLCIVSFRSYVFCLLVVLVKLSVLAKWLARKTPLRKPIAARGSSPENRGRRVRAIFLVYCIASLFYYVIVLSSARTWYIILLLWRDIAYLCWKCR